MDFLGLGADRNLDPSRRPRYGWGSSTIRTEASRSACREHALARNRAWALPQVPFLERVFELIQRYTRGPTVRQVTVQAVTAGHRSRRPCLLNSVAPAHVKHLEGGGHRYAESRAGLSRATFEEFLGVEVLPTQAVDVGLVRPQ